MLDGALGSRACVRWTLLVSPARSEKPCSCFLVEARRSLLVIALPRGAACCGFS